MNRGLVIVQPKVISERRKLEGVRIPAIARRPVGIAYSSRLEPPRLLRKAS